MLELMFVFVEMISRVRKISIGDKRKNNFFGECFGE